jgi:hypothetical protein
VSLLPVRIVDWYTANTGQWPERYQYESRPGMKDTETYLSPEHARLATSNGTRGPSNMVRRRAHSLEEVDSHSDDNFERQLEQFDVLPAVPHAPAVISPEPKETPLQRLDAFESDPNLEVVGVQVQRHFNSALSGVPLDRHNRKRLDGKDWYGAMVVDDVEPEIDVEEPV